MRTLRISTGSYSAASSSRAASRSAPSAAAAGYNFRLLLRWLALLLRALIPFTLFFPHSADCTHPAAQNT
jgi:hypothetical protein